MKYYLAPLEGITGYIYRSAYHRWFYPMDKYFTPFLVPNLNKSFTSRELNDILPEHNQGLVIIPQILTNCAVDFTRTADKLKNFGYSQVNLNLGCPSKTVVSKGRGSGFLANPEALQRFLEEIFTNTKMQISIKTRIGKDSPEEFSQLLNIYNQYPLEELIIHPRIQTDYYKNKPNLEVFREALEESKNPVCYNGDLFSKQHYEVFCKTFTDVNIIMFGRGIITNPGLISSVIHDEKLEKQRLRGFHDQIYHCYQEVLSGDRNVLFKMKELWFYMAQIFDDSHKYAKKIKKAEKCQDYEVIVNALFRDREIMVGDNWEYGSMTKI